MFHHLSVDDVFKIRFEGFFRRAHGIRRDNLALTVDDDEPRDAHHVIGKSKRSKLEVDFVVNRGNRRCYIQSAFAIPDEEKRRQETNSLRRTGDSYRKIVVVRDHIVPWFDENGIYYIGLEDFCLEYIDELDRSE